jgi:hypothetical protein
LGREIVFHKFLSTSRTEKTAIDFATNYETLTHEEICPIRVIFKIKVEEDSNRKHEKYEERKKMMENSLKPIILKPKEEDHDEKEVLFGPLSVFKIQSI